MSGIDGLLWHRPHNTSPAGARTGAGFTLGSERGLALIATLLVVVLIAVIVTAAVSAALSVTRDANAQYRSTRTFYAAEAGAEYALAQVELALTDGFLSDAELADIAPPTLAGYNFSEFQVVKDGVWDTTWITDGPFAGLYAISQNITVTSQATDASNNHTGVVLGATAYAIPLFQFAGFGHASMETYSGPRVDTYGRMHVNGDVFMAANDTHYHNVFTTAGRWIRDGRTDHVDQSDIHVYFENESGTDVEVDWDSEDTPDPDQFKWKSETYIAGHLMTGAMGVDSLVPPLPPGIEPIELIRPREASDGDAERASKFAWQADMYVTYDLSDVRDKNAVCGGSPPSGSPSYLPNITVERPQGGVVPDDVWKCQIFRFKWEAFRDYYDDEWADIADVYIGELRDWIVSGPGDGTQVVYVEIVPDPTPSHTSTTDPHGDGFVPSMRLRDGAQLPGPLTIGSEYPLWVMGDYNNINKQPAAIFTDRTGILSANWPDGDPGMSDATDTEQYFSMLFGESEGNLGCYHEDPEPWCIPVPDGYGPNGMLKYLEDWRYPCSGRCLQRMIGSFIAFWYPHHADALWPDGKSSVYRAPNRDWSFDFDLFDPTNLPPATPNVGYVVRVSFREIY